MVQRFLVRRLTFLLFCFLAPPVLAQGPLTTPNPSNTSKLLGTLQIAFTLEQKVAYLNGEAFNFSSAPHLLGGRAMVPLREFADALNLDLRMTEDSVWLGKLEIKKDLSAVNLSGVATDPSVVQLLEGQIYVSIRTLADALEGFLGGSSDGRTLTFTLLTTREGSASQPQARFATNKTSYAQGEPVLTTDYSYDPDGLDLPIRKWNGKQSVYFAPGEQTLTLTVSNQKNISSLPFSRKITITNEKVDTPLSYALKYAPLGSSVTDSSLPYPRLNPLLGSPDSTPLLFSDSPEVVPTQGLLYQDTVYSGVNNLNSGTGRARIVAHHLNGTASTARVFVVARNPDAATVSVTSSRLGESAPARFAGTLGQATLLDYFADTAQPTLLVAGGQSVTLYSSPPLAPGAGMNLMLDLELVAASGTGRLELSVILLSDPLLPMPEVIQQLPALLPDGRHVRGTFLGAVRRLSVDLSMPLPAKVVLGDALDAPLQGTDALSRTPTVLRGNYGMLYELTLQNAGGVVGALSARGGLYKGAVSVTDPQLGRTDVLPLPASGVISDPNQPILFMRANDPAYLLSSVRSAKAALQKVLSTLDARGVNFKLQFVPASGSNLPVHLIFYRPANLGAAGAQPQPLPSSPAAPTPAPLTVPGPLEPAPGVPPVQPPSSPPPRG